MNLARATTILTALTFSTLGLAGCSSGDSSKFLTSPGPAIPTTCTSADYAPSGFSAIGTPACLYHRQVIDFSHPGVVVVYSWIQSLALPHLTAIGELTSGSTPEAWVKMRNGVLKDSWDQYAVASIGTTDTTLKDYFTAADLAMHVVGGELRSIVYPYAYSIDEWNQQGDGSVTDGKVDFTLTKDSPWGGDGEVVVIFAGTPTTADGTISGDTVTWTITGTEATLAFHAAGPAA